MPEFNISGVPVSFPFEPYAVQRAYMEKVIECLQMSSNGVLESPTGTGKTLSLLCSSLGWLMVKKAQLQINSQGFNLPEGDFVMGLQNKLNSVAGAVRSGETGGMWGMPKIIYASRTHGQLTQAMQELKRTTYNHVRVAVLGSRDQLCIHPEVSKETNNSNKVHLCRMHVGARSCVFHNNVDAKKEDPMFNSEGILDIEDLVKAGRKLRCCPYFVAKDMKTKADIIFMPYNYLLDPKTRRAHGIELMNNVVILDEAHNIEKMCEESASLQFRSSDMALCLDEVTHVMKEMLEVRPMDEGFTQTSGGDAKDFSAEELSLLKTMLMELEKVIDDIPVGSEGTTHPGSYIFEMLAKAELTHSKKTVVLELIDKISQYLSTTSASPFARKGSGLQKFSDLLKIVFSGDVQTAEHVENIRRCYKVHLATETTKKQGKSDSWANIATGAATTKTAGKILSYWCFSPGFGMQQLIDQGVRCVILTSGTLSPLPPLISELGIRIQVELENPHVIKASQVCVAVVGKGPDGFPLTSSYKTRNDPAYITSLGRTILNFCRIIPHGMLVFFSSYPIMKKCQEDWQQSGIWSQITSVKELFVEPQGKDSFNETMSSYYAQVNDPSLRGACFLAVVRGKVSEGLDFADINGRAVIITGVPYPPFMDPRIVLKQKYLDETRNKDSGVKQCLSGAEWYQLEASRAVNQAVGRVIRHADDYGAILLCDYRFGNAAFKQKLSAWLRPHIKVYPDFGVATRQIREFFRTAERDLPPPKIKQLPGLPQDGSGRQNTPVAAGFDQAVGRFVTKTKTLSQSTSMDSQWSLSDYKSQGSVVKDVKPKSLFEALEKPTTVIDFNDMSGLKVGQHSTKNVDRAARLTKVLKVKPMNISVHKELACKCRENSSDGLCTCPTQSTSKTSQETLDVASHNKAAILMYLKQLKKSLDIEGYLKFANTFKNYKTDSNYEEFIKHAQEIFLTKESLHPLLKDFSRFIKKEHQLKFLNFCAKLDGCKHRRV